VQGVYKGEAKGKTKKRKITGKSSWSRFPQKKGEPGRPQPKSRKRVKSFSLNTKSLDQTKLKGIREKKKGEGPAKGVKCQRRRVFLFLEGTMGLTQEEGRDVFEISEREGRKKGKKANCRTGG